MKKNPRWEYHLETHLDLVNLALKTGVKRLNVLAKDGWEPFMLLENAAMGFKTRMLFRRKLVTKSPS